MKFSASCLFLLTAWFAFSSGSPAQESSEVFKAGAARRDITPKEFVPMWGYGARHDALSTGVLDPLYAAAVVIKEGF